ncbi:MAG: class I SAM-dependent methyltransferase [Parvularculaceae bacterium]
MTADDAADAAPTPLEARLRRLIEANGPITVADYMSDALFHPHDGYYAGGGARAGASPVGADGDFVTAPEISQIFGELIGAWLVQSWIDLGAPTPFNLVELGHGRGALMADALRAAKARPEFLAAARIQLVESSGRLRHEQRQRLIDLGPPIDWADAFADTPAGPFLLIANEFFDCLPIRQFARTETSWRERLIGLGDDGLAFVHAPTPPPATTPLPTRAGVEPGDVYELGEAGEALMEGVATRLVADGGRALVIDYGHAADGCGDTLQAVRDHKPWPPLARPGEADVTAHVNFERLMRAAFDAGAAAAGPVPQGAFLDRLGLAARVERLTAGAPADAAERVRAGAFRIAAPTQMGEIFKAICVSAPGLPPPAGFA